MKPSSTMYKYILQSVENINWLAIISLVGFFSIFIVSAFWALREKKDFIDKMANMPLDENNG